MPQWTTAQLPWEWGTEGELENTAEEICRMVHPRMARGSAPGHVLPTSSPVGSPDHYIWYKLGRGLGLWYYLEMKDLRRKQGIRAKRMSEQNVRQKEANELFR